MKVLFQFPGSRMVAALFFVSVLTIACNNNRRSINPPDINTGGFTDFEGAALHEFNMTKDPVTGKIPIGIHAAERAQARAIFANQQLSNRPTLNTFTFQGPNNLGGRTRALAYDVRYNGTTNRIIIAGGVSGGVYKSYDDGATWVRKSPTGEHFSCTSIAQDIRPGMEDRWYYAVGEASGNSASGTDGFYSGNGVYTSTDNGETWTRLPASNTGALEGFDHRADLITKLVVHPTLGHVYMAALDAIYRSTDFGFTWSAVLTSGSGGFGSAMVTDIIITSPGGRLYAAFSGFSNSIPTDMPGVWTSMSGSGGSWTKIAGSGAGPSPAGWNPTGSYGRVVIAYAPSSENLVYALYFSGSSPGCPTAVTEAELFRWDDMASSWTNLSASLPNETGCLAGNDPFACQSGYDLVVAVKPDDASTVYIGGTNAYRSTDAGLSWTRIGGYASAADYSLYASSHPDIHSFVFQPGTSTTMLCCNDGGIQRTTDNLAGTVAWTQINTGYRTYQYYYVTMDPRAGNDKVMGGAQDNGSTRNIGGSGSSYEMVYGGDGVSVGLSDDISGSTYEYVGSQLGNIRRRTSVTALEFTTNITPTFANTVTSAGLFVTLFMLDPDNTQRLYYANDDTLHRTTTASTVTSSTWTKMTGVATAIGSANDITALATTRGTYSAATASLFMGTSNGKVFRLNDPTGVAAATAPVDITDASFPAGAYVSSISVNPRNDDTILVTFSSYSVTSVWWTGTANSATPTWTSVEGTLTYPSYRSSAIALTSAGVEYFVGTSAGLFTSTGLPGAVAWAQDGASEIGNAVVSSLAFRPIDGKLLVGTHGYGMWSTYLVSPIPVTITEFKGSLPGKNALLQWSTSSEYNSKHFELQRSYDGTNFSTIAIINAAGNSNVMKQYSYTDKQLLSEKNYYRLRAFDIDGSAKLSNTILIKSLVIQQGIVILSNPVKDDIMVRFVKATEYNGELILNDMSGRLIARQSFGAGVQQMQFNVGPAILKSGIYQLTALIKGERITARIIKE